MSAVKKLLSGFAKDRLDRDLARAMRWNEKIRNSADFPRRIAGLSRKTRTGVARAQAEVTKAAEPSTKGKRYGRSSHGWPRSGP